MTKLRALVPFVAASALFGCAGTKQMPTVTGEGGSPVTGAGGATTGQAASGGSSVATTGVGGSTVGGDVGITGTGGAVNCGLYHFQPTPKNADIMMVLDRSGSMKDVPDGASGDHHQVADRRAGHGTDRDRHPGSISWGLKTFPEAYTDSMSDCAGGITKAIDVQMGAMNGTR